MKPITKSKFAKMIGIKRQSVDDLIKTHAVNAATHNGKQVINLDGKLTKGYLAGKGKLFDNNNTPSVITPDTSPAEMDLEQAQITKKIYDAKHKKAVTEQTELRNAYIRGELVSREKVYDNIFLYLDRLHSNMTRNNRTWLKDKSNQITLLTNQGENITDLLNEFETLQLNIIADAKDEIEKRLDDIQEEQAGDSA